MTQGSIQTAGMVRYVQPHQPCGEVNVSPTELGFREPDDSVCCTIALRHRQLYFTAMPSAPYLLFEGPRWQASKAVRCGDLYHLVSEIKFATCRRCSIVQRRFSFACDGEAPVLVRHWSANRARKRFGPVKGMKKAKKPL